MTAGPLPRPVLYSRRQQTSRVAIAIALVSVTSRVRRARQNGIHRKATDIKFLTRGGQVDLHGATSLDTIIEQRVERIDTPFLHVGPDLRSGFGGGDGENHIAGGLQFGATFDVGGYQACHAPGIGRQIQHVGADQTREIDLLFVRENEVCAVLDLFGGDALHSLHGHGIRSLLQRGFGFGFALDGGVVGRRRIGAHAFEGVHAVSQPDAVEPSLGSEQVRVKLKGPVHAVVECLDETGVVVPDHHQVAERVVSGGDRDVFRGDQGGEQAAHGEALQERGGWLHGEL
ncbi:hypothetical protein BO71DRAFT_121843 [Aspergillus ellipticus CBS 707.79]|uniref:Uncharacterized protein n=1 Tax=Aspergillus ellipticus CBS 707.79 TaxID=1448320 RepID=A0A319DLI7_9EURO|nr:hypothetical protein BO71DRAFT_121843 [Aspergillus ellipticus CBS 707.79]